MPPSPLKGAGALLRIKMIGNAKAMWKRERNEDEDEDEDAELGRGWPLYLFSLLG